MSFAAAQEQLQRVDLRAVVKPTMRYLQQPVRLFREYKREDLRPDLLAGVTVAVIFLPQAIAFALIAELPPQMGLYAAIVAGIAGALWGSSNHLNSGPTNALSLLVLSTLSATAVPGSSEYIVAAGLMAVMVGALQLVMGLVRLGVLVNFVSYSVIVGFASGAGVLIGLKQIEPLLGIDLPGGSVFELLGGAVVSLPDVNITSVLIGVGTVIFIVALERINRRIPAALLSMVIATALVYVLGLDRGGVGVIGALPGGLPPLARLPIFNLELIAQLSTGALAVAAIGLVQTMAIARSVANQTGQRLDSNQEFVGQGMANIVAGWFSGYAVAGSFSRTAVNLNAGAKTPVSALISSLFVLLATLTIGPVGAYLPYAVLAGVLLVTAYKLIDFAEIKRILQGAPGDAIIMLVTFFGSLLLSLEFAVLMGIILSFALYIVRTSTPRVQPVLPDETYRHFTYQPEKDECVQMSVIEIQGDLYFGAVNYVEEFILAHGAKHPEQRFLIVRMHNVNHCDFSGIHMLESVVHSFRDRGGDVFLVRVNYRVRELMKTTGFEKFLGAENILDEDEAISHTFYHVLDPAICIYECPVRAFKECQNLPKRTDLLALPLAMPMTTVSVTAVAPRILWQQLHDSAATRPYIVDVREPREYRQGHIAEAESMPLDKLMSDDVRFPNDRQIIFVCRSGRRSRRAAAVMRSEGITNVAILEGGMIAWEAAGLLEALGGNGRLRPNHNSSTPT